MILSLFSRKELARMGDGMEKKKRTAAKTVLDSGWKLSSFLNLGCLAAELTQIVELRATDLTTADNGDAVDAGAVQRERALDANAIGRAANGERFANGTVAAGDDHAFEGLQTLAGALNNLHLNADGVADCELGDVGLELGALDGTDDLIHWGFPPSSQGRS